VAKDDKRALAICYIDARAEQDRLDAEFGVDGWQYRHALFPDGSAVCRLRCRFGERWIVKSDVGSPSEQPDGGDRHKAAFSDALKRATVKFGIGRYLYRLPRQWVDWDAQKRQFVRLPTLPPPRCRFPGRLSPAPTAHRSRRHPRGAEKKPPADAH
jgi:hypothetical protein